jgi:hypothetical protein
VEFLDLDPALGFNYPCPKETEKQKKGMKIEK